VHASVIKFAFISDDGADIAEANVNVSINLASE